MSVYILSAKRTAIGSFMGKLSSVPAPRLGAKLISALTDISLGREHSAPPEDIKECIMGQVLTAGSGQAPARQAALYAGLKNSTQCMTVNKVCGSGLKAVMLACDSVLLKKTDVAIAGGQENMSLAPYLVPRAGLRLGHTEMQDSLIKDGLWDPYHDFQMGKAGEICAREYKISREEQDAFAVKSYKKALRALKEGWFKEETLPVEVKTGKKTFLVTEDEEPGKVIFEKIPHLKPVFEKSGSITPANASKINDGAGALLLASKTYIKSEKKKPLARIIAGASFSKEPKHFTTAPVQAVRDSLKNAGLKLSDIDLFEINEAFAVQTLAVSKELGIPKEKLNIQGGAVALGHPIGASGARILITLVYALRRLGLRFGLASICIGGGEALSLLVDARIK